MQGKTRHQSLIDTLFGYLAWGLGLVRVVLFVSFAAIIGHATTTLAEIKSGEENKLTENSTTAQAVVCTGKNLIEGLQAEHPEALAKIQKAALEIANGSTRFWKIEKSGQAPSWLFGTMHFSDPRVVKLPDVVEKAYSSAKTVVIENTQVLDPKSMVAEMAKLRPMMFFTDGSTLEKHFSKGTIELLKSRLVGRDLPYFLGKRMQPWVVATAIVMPICEIERKHRNEKVLDHIIGIRAIQEGKTLVGLESVKEQIGAMAGLPLDFHLKSLEETVRLGDKIDDMMETMVQLYIKGSVGMFWPLMEYMSPESSKGPGYAAFQEALITRRNKVMAERSLPHIEKGGVFMAVGALHLPGKLGVVQLLKDAGYKVTPAL